MRLGAQISTAGGLYKCFQRADEATCETILLFTKSNRQWNARPLTETDIANYQAAAAEYPEIRPIAAHASYLINLASPNQALWEKSYQALKVEVERADALGIPTLTFHPGAHLEADEATGLANIARALNRLLDETAGCQTVICLETMAGQGTVLGHRFEHLAYVLEQAGYHPRLGVCLDTCHVFAAGYNLRTPEGYEETLAEFDRLIGLKQIYCFHFNDSRYGLGERKDRHAHIGWGQLGLEAFANFLNDPRWADYPAYLETPKTEDEESGNPVEMDPVNLKTLRELVR